MEIYNMQDHVDAATNGRTFYKKTQEDARHIYFMPKIRTHVFGVVNEATNEQYHYKFHELGKSDPNSVISMVHDVLENQLIGLQIVCSFVSEQILVGHRTKIMQWFHILSQGLLLVSMIVF